MCIIYAEVNTIRIVPKMRYLAKANVRADFRACAIHKYCLSSMDIARAVGWIDFCDSEQFILET